MSTPPQPPTSARWRSSPALSRAAEGIEGVEADRRHAQAVALAPQDFRTATANMAEAQVRRRAGRRPGLRAGEGAAGRRSNAARGPVNVTPEAPHPRQPPGDAAVPRCADQDGVRGAVAPDRHQLHLRQGRQERRQDHDLRAGRADRAGHRPGAGPEPARAPGAVRQHGADLSEQPRQAEGLPGPDRQDLLPQQRDAEGRRGAAEDRARRQDAVRSTSAPTPS